MGSSVGLWAPRLFAAKFLGPFLLRIQLANSQRVRAIKISQQRNGQNNKASRLNEGHSVWTTPHSVFGAEAIFPAMAEMG
jgi:hypothetical protein